MENTVHIHDKKKSSRYVRGWVIFAVLQESFKACITVLKVSTVIDLKYLNNRLMLSSSVWMSLLDNRLLWNSCNSCTDCMLEKFQHNPQGSPVVQDNFRWKSGLTSKQHIENRGNCWWRNLSFPDVLINNH